MAKSNPKWHRAMEAKAQRAGTKAKARVNPGGDYRQAIDVKVRWDESGTKLERA